MVAVLVHRWLVNIQRLMVGYWFFDRGREYQMTNSDNGPGWSADVHGLSALIHGQQWPTIWESTSDNGRVRGLPGRLSWEDTSRHQYSEVYIHHLEMVNNFYCQVTLPKGILRGYPKISAVCLGE